MHCYVKDTVYVFLIHCDNYQYKFASLGSLRLITVSKLNDYNISFYLNDGCLLCCSRASKGWSAYFFTSFIDTNINILYLFFLLRCAQSIFLVHNIIRIRSLFIFFCANSSFIAALQLQILYCFFGIPNCFVDVSNFFKCLI